jgi:hypothetical protein
VFEHDALCQARGCLGTLRHVAIHGLVEEIAGDDAVAFFDCEAVDRGTRNALDERRDAVHAALCLCRPADGFLRLDVEFWDLLAVSAECRRGSGRGPCCRRARSRPFRCGQAAHDEQPGFDLARVVVNLWNALLSRSVLWIEACLVGHLLGDLEVRLVICASPVSMTFVELVLPRSERPSRPSR